MNDEDLEIIAEIRGGNLRRFGTLVDRHKDRAMTLALRLVGTREEAEEVVQDSFVKAYDNLHKFRGDSRFSTWFYRILYNACMTRVQRRKDREVSIEGDIQNSGPMAVRDKRDVLLDIEEREMQTILRDEIARLPFRFRTPVTLFYVQEMSYEEISEVTGQPVGTVKTNLFRGRHALRQRMLARVSEENRK